MLLHITVQARGIRTVSVKERDALLNELHSLAGAFGSKHDKLHEQVSSRQCQLMLASWVVCIQ